MFLPRYIVSSLLLGLGSLSADVLIFDDFGPDTGPNANLNGYTPVEGPANWVAYSAGTNQGWKVYSGEALLGSSGGNGMAGITMGSNYFESNPDIYSLKANFTMTPSSGTGWYAIGFATSFPNSSNQGFYNPGNGEGRPWLFVRNNGELHVRDSEDNDILIQSGFDVSDLDVELLLDTTGAQWTVDGFANGVQLDLDSTSVGMTYVYSSNPTTIGAVGLSATSAVDGSVQTFTLETVPEPETYALILGCATIASLLIRRRSM